MCLLLLRTSIPEGTPLSFHSQPEGLQVSVGECALVGQELCLEIPPAWKQGRGLICHLEEEVEDLLSQLGAMTFPSSA